MPAAHEHGSASTDYWLDRVAKKLAAPAPRTTPRRTLFARVGAGLVAAVASSLLPRSPRAGAYGLIQCTPGVTQCPPSTECIAGLCLQPFQTSYCPTGFSYCHGQCINTQSDPNHCGGCNVQCPYGIPCTFGACTIVEAPLCSNTQTDPSNCGRCGNVCPLGQTCSSGACVAAQAPAPAGLVCPPAAAATASGSNPSISAGQITVSTTGDGTIVLTPCTPPGGGTAAFGPWFDVKWTGQSSITGVQITFCGAAVGDSLIWLAGGGVWEAVTPSPTFDAQAGCLKATINASSSPSLVELTGTNFARCGGGLSGPVCAGPTPCPTNCPRCCANPGLAAGFHCCDAGQACCGTGCCGGEQTCVDNVNNLCNCTAASCPAGTCCDASQGLCIDASTLGQTSAHCGLSGLCQTCPPNAGCVNGQCICGVTGQPASQGPCPPCDCSNCSGCCDSGGFCRDDLGLFRCGSNGSACLDCGNCGGCLHGACGCGAGASGCCFDGTCFSGITGSVAGFCKRSCGATTPCPQGYCCDVNGACQASSNTTCGTNGATCQACPAGAQCQCGACTCTSTGQPPVNGACAPGGVCGPGTSNPCANGCCDGNGVCQTELSNTQCGGTGNSCVNCGTGYKCVSSRFANGALGGSCACDPTTCGGCCDFRAVTLGLCDPGNSGGLCGSGGATCQTCLNCAQCINGTCCVNNICPATCCPTGTACTGGALGGGCCSGNCNQNTGLCT